MPDDPLSLERIKAAIETLLAAAFLDGFHGAIESVDHEGTLIEAKRNLTALIQVRHGVEAWEEYLHRD